MASLSQFVSLLSTDCYFQKKAAKEAPSKPVDILSEAAMRNAYYTCHNVQVTTHSITFRLQCNISDIKAYLIFVTSVVSVKVSTKCKKNPN